MYGSSSTTRIFTPIRRTPRLKATSAFLVDRRSARTRAVETLYCTLGLARDQRGGGSGQIVVDRHALELAPVRRLGLAAVAGANQDRLRARGASRLDVCQRIADERHALEID